MADVLGFFRSYSEQEIIFFLCTLLNFFGLLSALLLQFMYAEYGRYFSSNSTTKWGFGIHPRIAWFSQELPMFTLPLIFLLYAKDGNLGLTPNTVLICMLVSHYFRRVFIYSFQLKGGKPTPFLIWFFALTYTLINGYVQGRHLAMFAEYNQSWFTDPRFIVGVLLFFTGMMLNIQADNILTNLRKPGETGYKIPRGGLFEYVSGANFFSEILEWSGFAVACWSYPAFTYAFFTLCNIGPRACQHHRFYLEKFEDYPKTRKALIPFLL
ncbi:3-oxo-5-alpha-steroid 4-dehydrogenase 1-like [Actinia tenebrosa]|uniref:3-oxo-5alpha-steroid 4-dehydrogenase (NADP(+)) n=1 Tax=Actinia tenebrosa TaxID=6105 RepID=A0A6P8I8H5_ACTTE|nr:3-oxo-5-alpha-steroid 4-dehydrogenase 1-like [Actinia tenebrosa]